jgi:hypothetical protein
MDVHIVPQAGIRRIEELAGISDVSRRRPAQDAWTTYIWICLDVLAWVLLVGWNIGHAFA